MSSFWDGEIFRGLAKWATKGITIFLIAQETRKTYQKTQDIKQTGIICLQESLMWFTGMEIGRLGFAVGSLLSKERWYLSGFFMASVFSAISDYLFKKYMR